VPPPNDQRRAELADAAIALLAEAGVHGVTHRAVEKRAGLPTGTASNYFRSREALLVAAAERVVALHHADMRVVEQAYPAVTAGPRGGTAEQVTELLTGSLLAAATTHRDRYLAIFELRMESLRRPALAGTLTELLDGSVRFTADHHAALDLDIAPEAIPALVALYGGALFALVTSAPGEVTEEAVRDIAEAIVRGALGDRAG
jgi:AcrR family transcriptional regulator